MKHKKFERIWWSVLINPILLFTVWATFKSHIWAYTNDYSDVFLKLFAIIGMIAVLFGINWVIEQGTRIEIKKTKNND
jgi:uncharacterized membrane protein YoaK (UPF0700 family)